MIRRWAIRPNGPAILARRVAGREKAVIVKLTASSSWCSIMKASSPLSGCPGQGAVGEPLSAGLIDGIDHTAGCLEPHWADPQAKDHHRARGSGRCGGRNAQPSSGLHLPPTHGIPGLSEPLVAVTDQHPASEVVIPLREIACCRSDLAVCQRGIGQPFPRLAWQHREPHRPIMPGGSPATHGWLALRLA